MARIVHLTSTGPGISSATLFVIVIIVAVLGYVILERGGESKASDSQSQEKTRQPLGFQSTTVPDTTHQEVAEPPDTAIALTDVDDVADTEPAYSDYSDYSADDETDYEDDVRPRRDLKPTRPALRDRNKQYRGKSASFSNESGGGTADAPGTAATSYRMYSESSGQHWAADHVLQGKRDAVRDEIQPTWDSNLRHFRSHLQGKTALLEQMDEVESLVFEDWSTKAKDGTLKTDPEWHRRRKLFMADDWVPGSLWGHVPKVMGDVCKEILAAGVIDRSALADAMMNVEPIRDCGYNSAGLIINAGFKKEEIDGKTRWVETSSRGPLEILLGWFVLPYKGYEKYLWTYKEGKSGTHHYEGMDALREPTFSILLWLSWAGHRYLANRLFSLGGAELLDGTLRVAVSKYTSRDGNSEFKFDVTMFVPETKVLRDPVKHFNYDRAKRAAYWLLPDLSTPALHKSLNLARAWIDKHFLEDDIVFSRITMRRLFIRPGYTNFHVNTIQSRPDQSTNATLFNDTRPPVLMQLDDQAIETASQFRDLDGIFQFLDVSVVKFVNRRQNSWYTPDVPDEGAHNFDTVQMAFMLGLLVRSMGVEPKRVDKELRGEDAKLFTGNTWHNAYPNKVDIDFGGIMPFETHGDGEINVCFPWAKALERSGTFYIPFLRDQSEIKHMVYPGMEAVDHKYVIFWTTEWIANQTSLAEWAETSTTFAIVTGQGDDVEKALLEDLKTVVINYMAQEKDWNEEQMHAYVKDILKSLEETFALTTVAECQMTNVFPWFEKLAPTWDVAEMVQRGITKGKQPREAGRRRERRTGTVISQDPPSNQESEMAAVQALNEKRTAALAEKQIAEALEREAAESQRQMSSGRKGEQDYVTKKGMVKMTQEQANEMDRDYERKCELWGPPEKYAKAYDAADRETRNAMMDWEEETWRREELEKTRSQAAQ